MTRALFLFLILAASASADAIMKVRARDDNRRKYEFQFTLTRKEENRLDFKLKEIVRDYEIRTRKQVAERRGYAEEIYGEKNYELIRLELFEWLIYEDRFQRILHTNTTVTDVDDF